MGCKPAPVRRMVLEWDVNALVICNDSEEMALLRFVLQRAGLAVVGHGALEEGLADPVARSARLVLVAVRAGSLKSEALRVRRETEALLAVVASMRSEDDICQAYEAGADLVVTRPYSARLLGMQLRALLRRSLGSVTTAMPSYSVGGMALDPLTRTVRLPERSPCRLTPLEFRLLHTLMLHVNQTVPTETIVDRVWGFDGAGGTELVRGLVRRLRRKVEENARAPKYVVTEPGIGYRLEPPGE